MTGPEPSPREQRRRERELAAIMRDLDRRELSYDAGTARSVTPRRGQSRLLVTGLAAALVVGAVLVHPGEAMQSVRRTIGIGPDRPLPAPTVTERGGSFAYAATQSGSDDPVGWNPCEPIEYVVNPAAEPPGGRALIERAVERTSAATGLAFEDGGDTDRRPFEGSLALLGRTRPVVIGWSHEGELPGLVGPVAGLGGGVVGAPVQGRRYYVGGNLALDVDAFTATAVAEHPLVMEAVVLHELAHVVGLGHVSEPMELMYGDNGGQVAYGPGDLEGLARLGSLPCR